jgi:dTDP-4-dehydrorhamnose reductase
MENAILSAEKDINMIRMSFLKSINGNKYIAVMGALGQPGNTVKVKNDKGTQLGVYKVLDSITGQVLKSIKNVKGNALYDLYLFDKKI